MWEGQEGEKDTENYKEKERERGRGRKERSEGRAGLLAWDESARPRGQDKTSDRTSFELVGISLRLDESKRANEWANELCRAMVSYYVSHRWVSQSAWFRGLFVAGTETACSAPRAHVCQPKIRPATECAHDLWTSSPPGCDSPLKHAPPQPIAI